MGLPAEVQRGVVCGDELEGHNADIAQRLCDGPRGGFAETVDDGTGSTEVAGVGRAGDNLRVGANGVDRNGGVNRAVTRKTLLTDGMQVAQTREESGGLLFYVGHDENLLVGRAGVVNPGEFDLGFVHFHRVLA